MAMRLEFNFEANLWIGDKFFWSFFQSGSTRDYSVSSAPYRIFTLCASVHSTVLAYENVEREYALCCAAVRSKMNWRYGIFAITRCRRLRYSDVSFNQNTYYRVLCIAHIHMMNAIYTRIYGTDFAHNGLIKNTCCQYAYIEHKML